MPLLWGGGRYAYYPNWADLKTGKCVGVRRAGMELGAFGASENSGMDTMEKAFGLGCRCVSVQMSRRYMSLPVIW